MAINSIVKDGLFPPHPTELQHNIFNVIDRLPILMPRLYHSLLPSKLEPAIPLQYFFVLHHCVLLVTRVVVPDDPVDNLSDRHMFSLGFCFNLLNEGFSMCSVQRSVGAGDSLAALRRCLRFPSPITHGILQVDYLSTWPASDLLTRYTRGSTLSTSGRLLDVASRQPP
jgi:hypothetical protein